MLVKIARGLDVPIDGKPEPLIDPAVDVRSVALSGLDYTNLRPAMRVAEGEQVVLGQPLFAAKDDPRVVFTAPATGRVRAINRGAKRRLLSVVIDVDDDALQRHTESETVDPRSADAAAPAIRTALLESGLWTALRARPYGGVASPRIVPRAIFVNAMQSDPLAAQPGVALAGGCADLEDGVACLSLLGAKTYLCKAPSLAIDASRVGNAEIVDFVGPYPAGLPGTHINLLTAVTEQPDVWNIGYQDVAAVGKLLTTGVLSVERTVAIGGPCAKRPRHIKTRIGAHLDDLLEGEIEGHARIVSGSPLSGRAAGPGSSYLGRYDTQISLLREHAGSNGSRAAVAGSTALNGWPSGMLSVETFERAWPFDVPPIPLLRALLAQDVDTAHALGCLGFEEEDLALCSYLCPAKYDYGAALRATLERLRSEQ